jgi:DNA-binding response OmpR family regulator
MGIRVLIVEDDDLIGDSLAQGLLEEGLSVRRVSDGSEAWAALQIDPWDVVILDWWLPGEDGLSILKRFRQRNRQTPVLFLTARDAVDERVRGLDAGADDYLCKPFAFDELLARIRALLRRQEERSDSVLNYEDLQLDLKSQQVRRGGLLLELTAREYSLLVYLMRHPDEVLSRTRIYEHVWNERSASSNTLEVHIMALRRNLGLQGKRLIHTVRGRGYLFGRGRPSNSGEVP